MSIHKTGAITMAQDKLERATLAAADVFLRYGYARTTMGDIAKAAGMSRPALYLLFPGKEQAFEAGTMFLARRGLDDIRSALQGVTGLQPRLAKACVMLLVRVFELQHSVPDARDMDDLRFPVVRAIYAMCEEFFAGLIADEMPAPAIPADEAARVLLYGARGLRDVADSGEGYRLLIEAHVGLVCSGLVHGMPLSTSA
jgi:AcrR family transcriptional regulator